MSNKVLYWSFWTWWKKQKLYLGSGSLSCRMSCHRTEACSLDPLTDFEVNVHFFSTLLDVHTDTSQSKSTHIFSFSRSCGSVRAKYTQRSHSFKMRAVMLDPEKRAVCPTAMRWDIFVIGHWWYLTCCSCSGCVSSADVTGSQLPKRIRL